MARVIHASSNMTHSIGCTLFLYKNLSTLIVMPTATWEERSTWGKFRVFSPFSCMRRVVSQGGCVMSSFDGVVAVVINGCLTQCCLGFYMVVITWRNTTLYSYDMKKEREFFLFRFLNFFCSPLSLLFFLAPLGEFYSFSLFSTFWFLFSFFLFVFPYSSFSTLFCYLFVFLIFLSPHPCLSPDLPISLWIFLFILVIFISLAYNFIHYLLFLCFFFFENPIEKQEVKNMLLPILYIIL